MFLRIIIRFWDIFWTISAGLIIVCLLNGLILQVQHCAGNENLRSAELEPIILSPVVGTEYGKVQGVSVKNHYEFRGIPFAKSPTGILRFKPPVKPNSWKNEEPLIVDKFSEYCIQFNVFWNVTEGQEDCLYINVFTPAASFDQKLKVPVIVYIHPGGFMFGRGSQFRGDYFMEMENVVLVTFHYRLGSFGFLNTGDEEIRGNMGLKDQVFALHWVRDNIRNFGGNADIVTIFGTSAGAASVHYHILSPMSKGLFHRAMSSSGTALCPWAFQPNPQKNTRKLATLLNCPEENSEKLVSCLQEKDANEISDAHSQFIDWYTDPISAFGPSVEPIISGVNEQNFLIEEPWAIIKSGKINTVPWLVGFNSEEGYDHSSGIVRSPKLLKDLNENWLQIYPSTFEYVNTENSLKNDIANGIRELYFNGKFISLENLPNLTNAYSDSTFVHCTVQSALMHAKIDKYHPVHLYRFSYKGKHSILNLRGLSNDDIGANHMDDLQYTMNSILYPYLGENHPDKVFQKTYLGMLTSFAQSGKLTPLIKNGHSSENLEPLKPTDGIKWYNINADAKMEKCSDEFALRMKFWDDIHNHNYDFLTINTVNKDEL